MGIGDGASNDERVGEARLLPFKESLPAVPHKLRLVETAKRYTDRRESKK